MLHEVQMYSQITPMEIDILFKLAECRHPDGSVARSYLTLSQIFSLSNFPLSF